MVKKWVSWVGAALIIFLGACLAAFLPNPALAAASKNKLTIVNQSGDDTAVKIMGPREWIIEIPAGQERTVLLPSGDYYYITRYGQDPDFRYSRGTPFSIEPSKIGYTEATLTLISAPSSTYVDPNLMEQFNRPPIPEPSTGDTPPKTEFPTSPGQPPPPDRAKAPGSKPSPEEQFLLHQVAEGENLPSISEWYSGEADYWPEIAKYNTAIDPLRLKPGTVVKIPVYLAVVHQTPPAPKPGAPSAAKTPKKPPKVEKVPILSPPPSTPAKPKGPFGPK